MGLTKRTLFGIVLFKLNIFSCVSQVPSIDSTCSPRTRGLKGIDFFLLSTNSTYSRIPGDQGGPVFFRWIFFGGLFMFKLEYYNLYLFNLEEP